MARRRQRQRPSPPVDSVREAGQELVCTPLISGLPDDVAILCLVKVPRTFHHVLKCVSKRWKLLLNSEEWLFYLRRNILIEPWIHGVCEDAVGTCLYVLDPSKKCWKRIKKLPPSCQNKRGIFSRAIDKKLYILGFEDSPKVYFYDASTGSFGETIERPWSRSPYACEAINGKLYIISGKYGRRRHTYELIWETFDPNMNMWTTGKSAFVDRVSDYSFDYSFRHEEKIHLRFCRYMGTPAEELILQPASSTKCERVVGNMVHGWRGRIVVVNGALYMLDNFDEKMKMWNEEAQEWVNLVKLQGLLWPCCLAVAGTSIYVISAELQTVVIDVSNLGNVPRTFTSFLVRGHAHVRVLCCTTLSYSCL